MENMKDDSVDRTILVCSPTKRSIRKISKVVGKNHFKWAYFGENVPDAVSVERQLGDKGERIDIADTLQETAHTFRQSYIDYIGKLSVKHNSMSWWASSLSEKNPFISKTFLYSCYVKVAISLLESYKQDNLVFFVENRSLRLSLIKNISEIFGHGVVHFESMFSNVLESINNRIEFIVKHGWFLINTIYRIMLTRHFYHLNYIKNGTKNDLVLIHTWVDQRSFPEGNDFHDAYFGLLSKHIKGKGKNVAIVPYILHTVPYTQTIKKLINCNEQFLVPSAYLKISDIAQILKTMSKKPKKYHGCIFENIDISDLIYNDFKNDWKSVRKTSNLLHYCIVKNLNEHGISVERFIYTYENHTWEKVYCLAFREFYPSANLVGYQHAAISKMFLNYSISENEHHIIPFPDKVITSGKYPTSTLLESGYNKNKLICGGAIRYEYLTTIFNKAIAQEITKSKQGSFDILVTTSIDKNEAGELLLKVLEAFESFDMYNVVLKCHPIMPYQQIAKDLNMTSLPKHFTIATQPISSLLDKCDLLIYTSSTTCIEALTSGVPVLHICSNYIVDRDILDSLQDIRLSARTVEEIRSMTRQISEMNLEELYKRKMTARSVAEDFFGAVNNSTFDLFLKK